jgi:hypothetical protein
MLIDLNQLLIANLMQAINNNNMFVPDEETGKQVRFRDAMSEGLIRHMCINTIRAQVKNFKSKYPNVIIACDNRHYWRKAEFVFYKSHRKNDREASGLDWNMIFGTMNVIRDELKENFPYKVIDVHMAEADDIIAVLSARLSPHGPVLILSSDKDFGQLQKYPGVSQYAPGLKRFVKIDNPTTFIREHIIKGDRGDGIPNILSPDNCFAAGDRQKPISSKKLNEWVNKTPEEFCTTEEMLRGYKRNQRLIDFDYIPTDIQTNIVAAYEAAEIAPKQKLLDYFVANKMKVMIECIYDF